MNLQVGTYLKSPTDDYQDGRVIGVICHEDDNLNEYVVEWKDVGDISYSYSVLLAIIHTLGYTVITHVRLDDDLFEI